MFYKIPVQKSQIPLNSKCTYWCGHCFTKMETKKSSALLRRIWNFDFYYLSERL